MLQAVHGGGALGSQLLFITELYNSAVFEGKEFWGKGWLLSCLNVHAQKTEPFSAAHQHADLGS